MSIMKLLASCAIAYNAADNYYFRKAFEDAVTHGYQAGFADGVAKCQDYNKIPQKDLDARRAAERELNEPPDYDFSATNNFRVPHRDAFRTTHIKALHKEVLEAENKIISELNGEAATYISDGWYARHCSFPGSPAPGSKGALL